MGNIFLYLPIGAGELKLGPADKRSRRYVCFGYKLRSRYDTEKSQKSNKVLIGNQFIEASKMRIPELHCFRANHKTETPTTATTQKPNRNPNPNPNRNTNQPWLGLAWIAHGRSWRQTSSLMEPQEAEFGESLPSPALCFVEL